MTEEELVQIESAIGCVLPKVYRDIMLAYPFPEGSFAAEVLLPNNPEHIIKMNPSLSVFGEMEKTFFIGSNETGDIKYYIDVNSPAPIVFRIGGMATNEKVDWSDHLDQLMTRSKEIEEEKQLIAERKANKQWWKVWK